MAVSLSQMSTKKATFGPDIESALILQDACSWRRPLILSKKKSTSASVDQVIVKIAEILCAQFWGYKFPSLESTLKRAHCCSHKPLLRKPISELQKYSLLSYIVAKHDVCSCNVGHNDLVCKEFSAAKISRETKKFFLFFSCNLE